MIKSYLPTRSTFIVRNLTEMIPVEFVMKLRVYKLKLVSEIRMISPSK